MSMAWLRAILISVLLYLASDSPANGQAAEDSGASLQTAEEFSALHAAYLENDRLQLERPVTEPEEPAEIRPPIGFFTWLARVLGSLGPLFKILFYIGVAVLAAAILYFIFGEALNLRLDQLRKHKPKEEDDVLPDLRPDSGAARSLLEEADALARKGRFGEAVHLLLFRSIEDIQAKRKQPLPQALTAREIGTLPDLPQIPRRALDPIIALVERNFFGGRDLMEPDWQAARASYEAFAFGEAWT